MSSFEIKKVLKRKMFSKFQNFVSEVKMQFTNNQSSNRRYERTPITSENFQVEGVMSGQILADAVLTERTEEFNTQDLQRQGQRLNYIFEQYLKEKRKSTSTPLPVEINNKGYSLNREQVCNEIFEKFDVYFHLSLIDRTGWFMEELQQLFLTQLKQAGKTKPTVEEKRQARIAGKKRQQDYAATLENWLNKLKESGRKLKLNNFSGGADNLWISEQVNIPYPHLVKNTTLCYQILKKAREEIGIENLSTTKDFTPKKYTYQILLDYGTDCRKGEVENKKHAGAQVNNTRSALLRFIKNRDLTLDSVVGPELGVLFDETLQDVIGEIENLQSRKQLAYEIRRWQKYYDTLLYVDSIPADFSSALKFLVEKSGASYKELERLYKSKKSISDNNGTISSWVRRTYSPSLQSLPLIYKIEEHFQLPRNTLAGRVSIDPQKAIRSALRKGDFPELSRKKILWIAKRLPVNFPSLSNATQKVLVTEALDDIYRNTNEYRHRLRKATASWYRLRRKHFTPEIVDEINQLVEFKTSDFTPAGYKRGENSHWTKNSTEEIGTPEYFRTLVETVFGVLTSPKEKNGLEVKVDQLTLTLLILPNTWRAYQDFMKKRSCKFPAATAFRDVGLIYSLIRLDFGWIAQSPWLAQRLQPIAGLLTEQEVAQARDNWTDFIQKTAIELAVTLNDFKKLNKKNPPNRDSHLPVLPILESDSPLEIIRDAIEKYQKKIPSRHTAPFRYAGRLRNIILIRILSETALRRRNLVNVTWKEDNTGQLSRGNDGHYHLEISHVEFKNYNSSFFGPPGRRHPYKVKLSETLTPLLDEYLLHYRSLMIKRWGQGRHGSDKMQDNGFLFVSDVSGHNQRISYNVASSIVVAFSKEHLAYNPINETSLKGVESFGPHSMRHIVATHILKKTGSFADAAAAIQDTEQTVRLHYAHYLPSDRDRRYRHLITDLMEEGR